MARPKGTGSKTGTGAGTKKGTGTKNKKGTGTGTGIVKRKYTMSDAALKQRRANNNLIPAETPEEMDYNARLIQHVINIQEIASHVDRKDPVSLRSAFASYLQLCMQDGCKVSNMAAYAAMGIDRFTIENWTKSEKPEYKELAKLVKTACSLSREQLIIDGKLNPVIGIFWQRNYDGLRNDTEQIQAVQDNTNDDTMTAGDIVQKYGGLLPE